ncbi:MAG TPA: RcnB family protein [Allosphingosinicella sp.]|jgi:Ni/Co efflux regulator RcnB
MRKLIMLGLMAAVAAPSVATAQSRAEIRHDSRELRQERQELRDARRYGDRRDIREERRDVREARRELREDRRDRRAYVAPYRGWSYRPVAPGYQLRSGFYAPGYVISNPGYYRLRPAVGNQRWIRYGDDLLLVNVRTGRVLQVLRGRYW